MVLFNDEEIPQSPISIKVLPSHDASKCKVYGPGLEGERLIQFLSSINQLINYTII